MSDNKCPEVVAYRLLHDIVRAEGKSLDRSPDTQLVSRKWLLDTYAECLEAAKGRREKPRRWASQSD